MIIAWQLFVRRFPWGSFGLCVIFAGLAGCNAPPKEDLAALSLRTDALGKRVDTVKATLDEQSKTAALDSQNRFDNLASTIKQLSTQLDGLTRQTSGDTSTLRSRQESALATLEQQRSDTAAKQVSNEIAIASLTAATTETVKISISLQAATEQLIQQQQLFVEGETKLIADLQASRAGAEQSPTDKIYLEVILARHDALVQQLNRLKAVAKTLDRQMNDLSPFKSPSSTPH